MAAENPDRDALSFVEMQWRKEERDDLAADARWESPADAEKDKANAIEGNENCHFIQKPCAKQNRRQSDQLKHAKILMRTTRKKLRSIALTDIKAPVETKLDGKSSTTVRRLEKAGSTKLRCEEDVRHYSQNRHKSRKAACGHAGRLQNTRIASQKRGNFGVTTVSTSPRAVTKRSAMPPRAYLLDSNSPTCQSLNRRNTQEPVERQQMGLDSPVTNLAVQILQPLVKLSWPATAIKCWSIK